MEGTKDILFTLIICKVIIIIINNNCLYIINFETYEIKKYMQNMTLDNFQVITCRLVFIFFKLYYLFVFLLFHFSLNLFIHILISIQFYFLYSYTLLFIYLFILC